MIGMPRSLYAIDQAIQLGTNVSAKDLLPLHQHDEHEVSLVEQGFGQVEMATGKTFYLGAGQLLFLPSGTPHRIDASCQLLLKGVHLHPQIMGTVVSSSLLQALPAFFHVPSLLPVKQINTRFFHPLLDMIDSCLNEWHLSSPWQADILLSLRLGICATLLRLLCDDTPIDNDSLTMHRIAQVKAWIDTHYFEKVSLADLAARANLSPAYFSVRFQQMYQIPPKAYQRQCCLRHAAQQLALTSLPIHLVGEQHGYISMAHFSRAFREYMGVSPTQYRQTNQLAVMNERRRQDTE